jgi:ribosomal-protein-alanine N-acetyltransferase
LSRATDDLEILAINRPQELPAWATRELLAEFLHVKMRPFHDELRDVERGLDYTFSKESGKGGFVVLAGSAQRLVGALVMPEQRGRGIGRRLIERALELCPGAVKLHVEPDNRARHLYERVGFTNKYLELRHPNR